MGVPNVVYKWKSLRTLYVTVLVMNIAGTFIVVILIVSAVKLRLGIGQYLDLVIPGDANFWPGMMFLIAFISAPIYAIGIRLCFHLRYLSPDSLPRLNQVLFIHCLLSLASTIIVIVITAVGIRNALHHRHINYNGIIESMQIYATEIMAKIKVDTMQINFKCCGSKSFKDWFQIRWIQKDGYSQERKNKEHNTSSFLTTDVPFSCCATDMLRPCIHHNVLEPSEVYLYQPEHRLTIATTGCHAKVLSHARYVGGMLIFGLILLAAYQMILAILSRLLQTAHSNVSYIGPRKDRYVSWILGSIPNPEAYDRLVYEGSDYDVVEETIPLNEDSVDSSRSLQTAGCKIELEKYQFSDIHGEENKKLAQGKKSSRILRSSSSSAATTSQEVRRKSSSSLTLRKTGTSSSSIGDKTNSIPTPPPSPGTEDKSIPGEEVWAPKIMRGLKASFDEEKGGEKLTKSSLSKNALPKVNQNDLDELRKSLECLKKYNSSWKGGSPSFQTTRPSDLFHQSSRVNVCIRRRKDSRDSELGLKPCPESGTSSSSITKKRLYNRNVCRKDSTEENETRIKKFCKDLSTEYNKSPYSKQRRECSEHFRPHQSRLSDGDDGRIIRNKIYARFNPADTYSRFRGSVQDTVMRRASQTIPGPPPILIPDQRPAVCSNPHRRPRQQYPENYRFLGRRFPYNNTSKPQFQRGGSPWPAYQKPGWSPSRCPQSVPTYIPISSTRLQRSSRCPYDTSYQAIQDHSSVRRQPQFLHDAETITDSSHLQRCHRRCGSGIIQPPSFSGC